MTPDSQLVRCCWPVGPCRFRFGFSRRSTVAGCLSAAAWRHRLGPGPCRFAGGVLRESSLRGLWVGVRQSLGQRGLVLGNAVAICGAPILKALRVLEGHTADHGDSRIKGGGEDHGVPIEFAAACGRLAHIEVGNRFVGIHKAHHGELGALQYGIAGNIRLLGDLDGAVDGVFVLLRRIKAISFAALGRRPSDTAKVETESGLENTRRL